jgi:hypothetical protein
VSGDPVDVLQQLAEAAMQEAEQDAVVDLDDVLVAVEKLKFSEVDYEAALEQLHHEPEDDQPVAWRRPS